MLHPLLFSRSPNPQPVTQNSKPKTQNPKLNNHHGEAPLRYLGALVFAICYFFCPLGSHVVAAGAPETALPTLSDEARSAAEKGLYDFQNQKFKDAKAEFQRMTDLAPDHPMGWANLGSAEFRLGEVDQAEEHLKKAVHLDS